MSGAGIVLYDGSPLVPPSVLWDILDQHQVTHLGVSPRYLAVLENAKYHPNAHHSLKSLRVLGTTGAPLRPEQYAWIRKYIKYCYLNNGSGGTDICNAFISSSPMLAHYVGEIQCPVLGMDVQAWNDQGKPVYGEQGNLVCCKPFPNTPLAFLSDPGGKRFHETYFEEYSTPVWYQADWCQINPKTGGFTMHGRSDGVLNPQGVRFGSAELYNAVEHMNDEIDDTLAVGQKMDEDERVILFVKTANGKPVSDALRQRIRKGIRDALSTRHLPAVIISAPDIPYNATGKKLEVAVKKILNGVDRSKINTSACANPASLDFYRPDLPELRMAAKRESKL